MYVYFISFCAIWDFSVRFLPAKCTPWMLAGITESGRILFLYRFYSCISMLRTATYAVYTNTNICFCKYLKQIVVLSQLLRIFWSKILYRLQENELKVNLILQINFPISSNSNRRTAKFSHSRNANPVLFYGNRPERIVQISLRLLMFRMHEFSVEFTGSQQ